MITKYKSLSGEPYASQWRIKLLLFDGYRGSPHKGMEDLAEMVEKIQQGLRSLSGRLEERERQDA